jgi:hypothetical protein
MIRNFLMHRFIDWVSDRLFLYQILGAQSLP